MSRMVCLLLCLCLFWGCAEKPVSSDVSSEEPEESIQEVTRPAPGASWQFTTSDRVYYRFQAREPDWITDPASFPSGFVEAAMDMVSTKCPVQSCALTKGYLYDFDQDGRQEAVLLLYGPTGDMDWYHGDSHFVYVNGDGKAQYLMSGCDIPGRNQPQTVFEPEEDKMQSRIIEYPGFSHLLVRGGNTTMASGSYFTVYVPSGNKMEKGFSDFYPSFNENGVFFVSSGPQGLGPRYTFWNTDVRQYYDVGAQKMPVAAFVQRTGIDAFKNLLPEDWRQDYGFTIKSIDSVSVIGNAYYRVKLAEKSGGKAYSQQMTVTQNKEGLWEAVSRGPMDYDLRTEGARWVSDVDIEAACRNAVSTPLGFDALDVKQIPLSSLPTEPVKFNTLHNFTDDPFLLWAELPENDISLYVNQQSGGVLLRRGESLGKFYWPVDYAYSPLLEFADYDGDGEKELSVILMAGHGTFLSVNKLYIVKFRQDGNMKDFPLMERLYREDLQNELKLTVDSEANSGSLHLADQTVSFLFTEPVPKKDADLCYRPALGDIIGFRQKDGNLTVEMMILIHSCAGGFPKCPARITADVLFREGDFTFSNIKLLP